MGTAYVVSKTQYNKRLTEHNQFTGDLTRKRLADKLSETPIDQLSDDDTIIKSGYSQIQRIVKSGSVKNALTQESMKDVMFATIDQNDNNWYKNFVKVKDWEGANGFKKIAMTMTNENDLVMPSERKRISTFVDMIKNNPEFRQALGKDISISYGGTQLFEPDWLKGKLDPDKAQSYYTVFQSLLGDEHSQSRKMYLNKIVSMGYNAMVDDNDANRYSKIPVILLNATNDVTITGGKVVNKLTEFLSMMKVTEFDVDNWVGTLERLN